MDFNEKLYKFMEERPAIAWSLLAKEIEIPVSTFKEFKIKKKFPQKHIEKLIPVLKHYGWKD